MFEKTILRRSIDGPAITIGDIGEALLYYQNIHLLLDRGGLEALVKAVGFDGVLTLLKRDNVKATYTEEFLGVNTVTANSREYHSAGALTVVGDKERKHIRSRTERLAYHLIKLGYPGGKANKFAEKFMKLIVFRKLSGDDYVEDGIPKAVLKQFETSGDFEQYCRACIANTEGISQPTENLRFELLPSPLGFWLHSTFDFEAADSELKRKGLGGYTQATLLINVTDAVADMALAAHYGGDFRTSEVISKIAQTRYAALLQRANISAAEIAQFQSLVLTDFPSVREVLNSGENSFDEFLEVVDSAGKFRSFIGGINSDLKLVSEYFAEVRKELWVQSLPAKVVRYAVPTAIGIAHPALGAALAGLDALFVDKFLGGWRPNHFIDGKLAPFLGEK